jgi:hypothetical protein
MQKPGLRKFTKPDAINQEITRRWQPLAYGCIVVVLVSSLMRLTRTVPYLRYATFMEMEEDNLISSYSPCFSRLRLKNSNNTTTNTNGRGDDDQFIVYIQLVWYNLHDETFYSFINEVCTSCKPTTPKVNERLLFGHDICWLQESNRWCSYS